MKTLQEIKNEYAQEHGYEDWADLYRRAGYFDETKFFQHEDAVFVLVQKAVLEKVAKRADVINDETTDFIWQVDRSTITNPENLVT